MATKHFCDGCDREIERTTDIKHVRITDLSFVGNEVVQNNPRDFDLCGGCYGAFKGHHLPSTWGRVGKAA